MSALSALTLNWRGLKHCLKPCLNLTFTLISDYSTWMNKAFIQPRTVFLTFTTPTCSSKAKGVPNYSFPEDYRAISSKGTYISSVGSEVGLGGKSSQGSSDGSRGSKASSDTRSSKTYSTNAYVWPGDEHDVKGYHTLLNCMPLPVYFCIYPALFLDIGE